MVVIPYFHPGRRHASLKLLKQRQYYYIILLYVVVCTLCNLLRIRNTVLYRGVAEPIYGIIPPPPLTVFIKKFNFYS